MTAELRNVDYEPAFQMNDRIIQLSMRIADLGGFYSGRVYHQQSLHLRKDSRINTIYSSLAIENNQLSKEQVTALINGKRVLGPERDIREVKNADAVYKLLPVLDPFSESDFLRAHGILTSDLVSSPGRYRNRQVGVFEGEKLIHAGIPARLVSETMGQLFEWLRKSPVNLVVKSCIFHYEMVFIHPFEDGNGRMARLWQSLILSQWNSIFSWLPVETLVFENQDSYYQAIQISDRAGTSVPFVEFMLECILKVLEEAVEAINGSVTENNLPAEPAADLDGGILDILSRHPSMTVASLAEALNLPKRRIERHIAQLKKQNRLHREGSARSGRWVVKHPV